MLNAGAYHSGYNQVPIVEIVAQVLGRADGLLLCWIVKLRSSFPSVHIMAGHPTCAACILSVPQ